MNKKIFNPKEWLEAPAKQGPQSKQMPTPIVSDNQFENYLQQIESTVQIPVILTTQFQFKVTT